jgi:hypothetical protein
MYRVALVCEGPSDRAILEAILDNYLDDYVAMPVQPPICRTADNFGQFGGGWKGIRTWCESEIRRIGGFEASGLLENSDLVIIQIDADVSCDPAINQAVSCPPASGNVCVVSGLLDQWLGVNPIPQGVVKCIPSMASETWALVALFDSELPNNLPIECSGASKSELRIKTRTYQPKLVVSQAGRLKNNANGYKAVRVQRMIRAGWHSVVARCMEAQNFHQTLEAVLPR